MDIRNYVYRDMDKGHFKETAEQCKMQKMNYLFANGCE